jgi:hypothetical protein
VRRRRGASTRRATAVADVEAGRGTTRYEILDVERREIRNLRAFSVLLPTAIVLTLMLVAGDALPGGSWMVLGALFVLPFVFDRLLRAAWPRYRGWADRAAEIARTIASARARVAEVFGRYRVRRRGERFKSAYELAGRSTRELEEALAVGMHHEGREVFVTAFMREGRALRVTASIGSPFRCSAADDPRRWKDHAGRLGCDEIRQYHNHPEHGGYTRPSRADLRSTVALQRLLESQGEKLRSFVICWNGIREWKVFEYEPGGRHWVEHGFDAVAVEDHRGTGRGTGGARERPE